LESSTALTSQSKDSPLSVFYDPVMFWSEIPGVHYPNHTVSINQYNPYASRGDDNDQQVVDSLRLRALAKNGSLEILSAKECINQYAISFSTRRQNVILIRNATVEEGDGVAFIWKDSPSNSPSPYHPYEWICSQLEQSSMTCQALVDDIRQNSTQWRPFVATQSVFALDSAPVIECLSEIGTEHCRLQSYTRTFIIVIVMNAIKAVAMLFLAFWIKDRPILTLGDAISSFLETPDPHSAGLGLITKYEVQLSRSKWATKSKVRKGKIWDGARENCSSASRWRWLLCTLL
jgi:hypothetical protein